MLRFFLVLSLFFWVADGCEGGFDSCKLKIKHSNTLKGNTLSIPISKHNRIIFSDTKPDKEILKYDKFLNLYLIKETQTFKYPFRINYKLTLGMASVDRDVAIEGKILKRQLGLSEFAKFSEDVVAPSLLLNSCCALEGIVTDKGIIEKEYIDRFLKSDDLRYGDIGIRVYDKDGAVIVNRVDPFLKNNKFKKGDLILELDSKRVEYAAEFMKNILFKKINSTCKIKIKRNNKEMIFGVKINQRYGGGYISDTFLEQKGVYFDKDLKIVELKGEFLRLGLKLGDKLLRVNGHDVDSPQKLQLYIDEFDDDASLLFLRDGFEFFVHIGR